MRQPLALDADGTYEVVDPETCREIFHLWDMLDPDYDYGSAPFDPDENARHFKRGIHLLDTDDGGPEVTFWLVARLAVPHLLHTIAHLRGQLDMVDSLLEGADTALALRAEITADMARVEAAGIATTTEAQAA